MFQEQSLATGAQRRIPFVRKALVLSILLSSLALSGNVFADTPLVTTLTYDVGGNVTSEIDPRGLTTSYVYDGLGQLWQQSSPDTGITSYAYDSYGRRSSMTRADGSQTAYSFDSINRTVTIASGSQMQSFAFDSCTNGVGRLCSASDATGSTSYTYSPEGWVLGRGFSVNGNVYALGYNYDAEGRLVAITYPDGNQAIYQLTNGAVSSVEVTIGGTTSSFVTNIVYRPANVAMSGWISNNGLSNSFGFDSDGRVVSIAVPGVQNLSFSYDYANRVLGIQNGIDNTLTQVFTYDGMSRLTSVVSAADNESYQYDANGNRTSQTLNGQTQSYVISPTSNQVTAIDGTSTVQYGYDALGNMTTVASAPTFHFNAFNRMDSSAGGSYYVNPEGRRLYKLASGAATYFAPDDNGSLLAETQGSGWNDYIWVNGKLVGLLNNGQPFAIHDDQTGRPTAMTNASGAVVWSAQNFAFTRNIITSSGPVLNLGFPGQYYDSETGNWNNGFRDYYAGLGRYIESDPLGLQEGVNTYAYAGGNPLTVVDPSGLGGFGINAGGSAQGGVVHGGAVQANSGVGLFWGNGLNSGWYTASGSFGGQGNFDYHMPGNQDTSGFTPDSGYSTMAIGASAGLGVGIWGSNASNATQLLGAFDTSTLNIGVISLQYASDASGTFTWSISFAKGLGFDFNRYQVTTTAAGTFLQRGSTNCK